MHRPSTGLKRRSFESLESLREVFEVYSVLSRINTYLHPMLSTFDFFLASKVTMVASTLDWLH
jgi:hypothetical protein